MRMDNSSHIEVDIALLGKYLSGEATAEEAMAVDDWLADPANRKQYTEMERMWNLLPGNSKHRRPDLVAAWSQLQNSLPAKSSSPVFKLIVNRYTVAAALVAVIITVVVILLLRQPHAGTQNPQLIVLQSGTKIMNDTLPDGSVIVMNKNSSIAYAPAFSKTGRQLKLEGEAFFNVQHDKANPFIISVDEIKVQVVGTSFNIRKTTDSAAIEVQVESGIVKMYKAVNEIMVHKGQTGIYTKQNATFSIKDSIDTNSLGYATGTFNFKNATLGEVKGYLEKTFGVTITASKEALSQCMMTGTFENKSLDYIMTVIAATLNITYTIQGNEVHIDGSCN